MPIVTNNTIKNEIAERALEYVFDPEIGLNVVDLGLIYQIDFDEPEHTVLCTMTLTTEYCPMGESIIDGVRVALEVTFPGYAVTVNLTFDPAWNHDRISEAGLNFLNR